MLRNQIVINLLCATTVLICAGHSVSDDECYDYTIESIDRLKMRLVNGTPFSVQEIQCRKLATLRDRQTHQDDQYFATQLLDHIFRGRSDSNQKTTINLKAEQKPQVVTINTFSAQRNDSEKSPINTLRGFKSVAGQQ